MKETTPLYYPSDSRLLMYCISSSQWCYSRCYHYPKRGLQFVTHQPGQGAIHRPSRIRLNHRTTSPTDADRRGRRLWSGHTPPHSPHEDKTTGTRVMFGSGITAGRWGTAGGRQRLQKKQAVHWSTNWHIIKLPKNFKKSAVGLYII